MSFYPAKKIGSFGEDGGALWIGSARDAADVKWLTDNKIGLVVNCTRHLPFARLRDAKFIRVAVHDDPSENANMLDALPCATNEVARALENGKNVLVHCHAGMQRSATVTAAALFRMRVSDMDSIVTSMMNIKPEIFPPSVGGKPTFLPALKAWVRFCRERGNPY